jgi:hypothetical protein
LGRELLAQYVQGDQAPGHLVGLTGVSAADPSLQFVQPPELSPTQSVSLGTLALG